MENPGLGTLAKLPREIRDMIFDLLFSNNDCPCAGRLVLDTVLPTHDLICKRRVAVSASVKEVKRVISKRLSPTLRTKCSRQFYREYLESYLRSIDILFAGRAWDTKAIIQTLRSLNKVADVASHTRKLSVSCHLSVAYENCPRTSLPKQESLVKFAETLKTLKRCERLLCISASKLSIAVFFDGTTLSIGQHLPITLYGSRQRELARAQTYLRACLGLPIEIMVRDRLQSVQNMERWCDVIEKLMYTCLTLSYKEPGVFNNRWPNGNVEEVIAKAWSKIKHTLSLVTELQHCFIDTAMQY